MSIKSVAAVLVLVGALACAGLAGAASAPALWRTVPPAAPLPPSRVQGLVNHDGARLWFATYGTGPPVILLHAGLVDSSFWGDQVQPLVRAGYRVVAIDSRGHGRSTWDGRPFTYELMASDVVAVMDRLKLPQAAVVGWSDGAIIGLVMAMRHPQRVTRVFAFAANTDPSGVKSDVDANPTFKRFTEQGRRAYARLSPTPKGFKAFSDAINRMWAVEPNYTAADLGRIRTPVAIVDGDHDEAIKADHTAYIARSIPGARLIILPGLSHFAMLQKPQAFNAAMLGFLKGA